MTVVILPFVEGLCFRLHYFHDFLACFGTVFRAPLYCDQLKRVLIHELSAISLLTVAFTILSITCIFKQNWTCQSHLILTISAKCPFINVLSYLYFKAWMWYMFNNQVNLLLTVSVDKPSLLWISTLNKRERTPLL